MKKNSAKFLSYTANQLFKAIFNFVGEKIPFCDHQIQRIKLRLNYSFNCSHSELEYFSSNKKTSKDQKIIKYIILELDNTVDFPVFFQSFSLSLSFFSSYVK